MEKQLKKKSSKKITSDDISKEIEKLSKACERTIEKLDNFWKKEESDDQKRI
jgi:ribosome recycling factor